MAVEAGAASSVVSEKDDTMTKSGVTWRPNRLRVAFGIGESVQGIYVVIYGFYLNIYLLEIACLSPGSVGVIQLMQGCFDAINDPMVGMLSDRTRSRWGRRRPWLLFSALPAGCLYIGLWSSIPDSGEAARFGYYTFMYMGMSVVITCIQVQVGSLVPELTENYDERTVLSGYRLAIGNLVGLVAVLVHGQLVDYYNGQGEPSKGYQYSALIFGPLMTINTWYFFSQVKERYNANEQEQHPSMWQGLKIVFANKPFLYVMGIYLCGPCGIVLVQTNLLLYSKYVLLDGANPIGVIGIVQGLALFSLPLWLFLCSRFGKKGAYYIGGCTMAASLGCLYGVDDSNVHAVWPISIIIGMCLGSVYLIPYSMLPDVIELDELKTGQRREGVYFGFFTIFMKLAVTLALLFTNLALEGAGYEAPQSTCGASTANLADTQPESVQNILRLLVSFFPSVCFLTAVFFAYKYPITREVQEDAVKEVNALRTIRSSQHQLNSAASGANTKPAGAHQKEDAADKVSAAASASTNGTKPPLTQGTREPEESITVRAVARTKSLQGQL